MSDTITWLETAVGRIQAGQVPHHFDTRHLDELGWGWDGLADVPRVLETLVTATRGQSAACRVALAIPLVESEDPPRRRPELHDLVLDVDEPPSIYVLGEKHLLLGPDTSDRLHLPYPTTPWGPPDDLHVELVARRDREAAERGWGWANTLWFHVRPAVRA
ncbi:hypothetical protein ACFP63_03260 [Oerskovia jenensis]|uniref:Uncharacterized protein n=1 Tax=Oerskovia jenensis TaxID=162169 RepID=A0ABS2LCA0_9CELL|nr:hypothetical protein [Oerskovia jenensis]MBM7477967.1 hypothetical protein [Oerskovia jenensis]